MPAIPASTTGFRTNYEQAYAPVVLPTTTEMPPVAVVSVVQPGSSEAAAAETGPPPIPPLPDVVPTTPWTLGSTDGSYAIQLLLNQQREIQQTTGTEIVPNLIGSTITVSSADSHNSPPGVNAGRGGGAAIGDSGGAHETLESPQHGLTPTLPLSHLGAAAAPRRSTDTLAKVAEAIHAVSELKQSLYQDRLLEQPSTAVETVLAASCEVMNFDIAEMWLRTGPRTHQLTNSHLRPTALEDSVRNDLVDVYYGTKSTERTHRLSPALCKRAKEANDVVWVTAHTAPGAAALQLSISNVRTAVAVPVCHETSNTNVTIIFFSIRR
jgi:hypothetical protein